MEKERRSCIGKELTIHLPTMGRQQCILANSTTTKLRRMHFDTDSYEILVDNCCSKSITNSLDDFIQPPKPSQMTIKGFNGATAPTCVGTVKWHMQDDKGKLHTIVLPETYYSPKVQTRLLSPQHWAQVARRGTKCTTYHDKIILSWERGKYTKTVPLSASNVGLITAPPRRKSFLHTCKNTQQEAH